jgi:hypothetical protein
MIHNWLLDPFQWLKADELQDTEAGNAANK